MNNYLFCPKCSGNLDNTTNNTFVCRTCSFEWPAKIVQKNQSLLRKKEARSRNSIPAHLRDDTEIDYYDLLTMELDETYFLSKSAREDFQKKVNFFENSFKPKYEKWQAEVGEKEDIVTEIKTKLTTNIFSYSKAIIKDYIGPFSATTSLEEYQFFLDVNNYNLDINTTELIEFTKSLKSPTVFELIDDVASKTNFKKMGKNLENLGSSNPFLRARAEKKLKKQTFDLAFNAVEAGVKAIGKNVSVINEIRKADNDFVNNLSNFEYNIKELSIQQRDTEKRLKYAEIQKDIFKTCLMNFKENTLEFEKEPIFIEFKDLREELFLQDELLELYKELVSIDVSFTYWESFRYTSEDFSIKILEKRLEAFSKKEKLEELLSKLNVHFPTSVLDIIEFQNSHFNDYQILEKEYRPRFKELKSYKTTMDHAVFFAKVLSKVKSYINN